MKATRPFSSNLLTLLLGVTFIFGCIKTGATDSFNRYDAALVQPGQDLVPLGNVDQFEQDYEDVMKWSKSEMAFFSPFVASRRFEKDIAKFVKQDRLSPPKKGSVLFIGSSSIRIWKTLAEDMEPIPTINRGFGGSIIDEVYDYAERIIFPYAPRAIVIYAGENDIANDVYDHKQPLKSFIQFVKLIHSRLPGAHIFFVSMKPSIKREQYWEKFQKGNRLVKKYIETNKKLTYIDVASAMVDKNGNILQDIFLWDELHMNEKGYAIWTRAIKPVLMDYLGNKKAEK